MSYKNYEQELKDIILSNQWFVDTLKAVRLVNPPNWYVGAGVIRSIVWDKLHGYTIPTPIKDVDVAIFDDKNLSSQKERGIQDELKLLLPKVEWEVTNQAAVHLWYEKEFGLKLEPYTSSEEAISTWPETATSIGVKLEEDGSIMIFAPYGLEDLFEMVLRRNPRQVTKDIFMNRLISKRICQKWPKVTVIYED